MPGAERRKAPRFKIKDCYLKCSKGGLLLFLEKPAGRGPLPVLNLSRGGVEFASSKSMDVGRKLRIKLDVPAFHELLKFRGQVRWVKAVPFRDLFRVGVQFTKVTPAIEKRLRSLEQDPMMRRIERVGQGLLD